MPAGIQAFLLAVQVKRSLSPHLQGVRSLEELAARAEEAGYEVTALQLQLWAHHKAFDAPWWPWQGLGEDGRRSFFRGEILPERVAAIQGDEPGSVAA